MIVSLGTKRLAGNLHCAPGTVTNYGGTHIHNVNPYNMREELSKFQAEHEIHEFTFGDYFPGMVSLLRPTPHLMIEGLSGAVRFLGFFVPPDLSSSLF